MYNDKQGAKAQCKQERGVGAPRPLSTEIEAPYTTALLPHIATIIIPVCLPKNKVEYRPSGWGGNGKNDLCCTCCGAVYGLLSVPALLFLPPCGRYGGGPSDLRAPGHQAAGKGKI